MPDRRFPPPWTVEEYRGISYIVRDANNFPVAYVYFESERGMSAEDCSRYRQAAGSADASAGLNRRPAALTLAEHIVCLTQKKQNLFKRKGPRKRRSP
jgi:hypothetical protein